jgi:ubiquinone/menaquinone biosynthesis C-methylase UbiE
MGRLVFNKLVNDIHDQNLKTFAEKYISGSLIDIGCGIKPYKAMLAHLVSEHVGVDHEITFHEKSNIDLFGTAYEIPVANERFNSAICTAVLEHLEEPEAALKECYRVLKKGGVAVYSMPFIWHLHEEPRDFYRYSKYGLKYLFEKAGFEILELKPLSGFWVTFGQLFIYYLQRFNRGPLHWLRIMDGISVILQHLFYFMDKVDRREEWTWMYMVVAKK